MKSESFDFYVSLSTYDAEKTANGEIECKIKARVKGEVCKQRAREEGKESGGVGCGGVKGCFHLTVRGSTLADAPLLPTSLGATSSLLSPRLLPLFPLSGPSFSRSSSYKWSDSHFSHIRPTL